MDPREEAIEKIRENQEKAEALVSTVSGGSPVMRCIGFILLLPLSSAVWLIAFLASRWIPAATVCMLLGLAGLYVLFRKKLIPAVALSNGILAGAVIIAITLTMVIAKGNVDGRLMGSVERLLLWLFPGCFFMGWGDYGEVILLFAVTAPLLAFFLSVILQKRFDLLKKAIPFLAAIVICIGVSTVFYANRPSVRYGGHGFEYMHGWSSTDFSDYMVWSEPSKLAKLDHPASLIIEEEKDMPRLDGAEACFPLYSAAAKAVYKDIAAIEKRYQSGEGLEEGDEWDVLAANGKIVMFTNTVHAFSRLLDKKVDIVFGARPSRSQMQEAEDRHIQLNVTPIGKEAFVFFVEPDNPVTNLSSGQIRAIYHGDVTNWKEVGGKDQPILAFQRPENSGSQAMMEWFMGDVSLKDPETYEYVDAMMGVLEKTAQYHNEKGAFGYSFRYFVEDLHQENDVRIIAVDGVLPTRENIENGSYPLTVDLCTVTREIHPNPYVRKMVDFMLSEDGQELVEKSGYGRVK